MIENQIRPLVRAARPVVPDLRERGEQALEGVAEAHQGRRQAQRARQHGRVQPAAAPRLRAQADRDEGYLYWGAWLGHNGVSVFNGQDAHGVYRRIYFTASCQNVTNLLTGALGAHVPPDLAAQLVGSITGLGGLFAPGEVCG